MGEINWTAAQRQAIEADNCSVAVSAAAGSGKTAVLTRRIIERVCSGKADLSRMLVVTFTRAAAAELVSRIGEELSNENAKNPGDRRIARQLLLLPSAKICTIDSFCLDLIRDNFPDTGVSGFGVLDAETEKMIKNEVMDELVTDYFDGNVTGDNAIEDFGEFSDTFGTPVNDGLLPQTAIRLYDYYGNTVDRNAAIKGECFDRNCDFLLTPWGKTVCKYASELFSHYEKLLGEAEKLIGSSEGCEGWLDGFCADRRYADLAGQKLADETGYDEMRALLLGFDSYRVSRLGAVKSEYKTPELEYYKKCRDEFKTAVKSLAATFFAYNGDTIGELTEKTRVMQDKMCAFLSEYDKRLTAEKKRRKVMGFADIERLALRFLYDFENKRPSAAAKETAERFDEIYIDEYQDTNEVQDLIFSLISREDNRFTVGDVKQSIYEFRGAEPMIFTRQLDGRERYEKDGGQKQVKLFLSENFRSTQEILSCVNGVFGKLMNAGTEKRYGDDERLNCGRGEYHGAVPEMHVVCRSDEDGEVCEEKYIAQKIDGIISSGEAKPGEIAVLLLTKTSAHKIEEALAERGIPCKNTAASEFFSNAEVLLALSILNTVDNPGRDVYLAGALKSPVYGVTLDELIYIRRFKKDGTLFSALKAFTEATGFAKGRKFLSDHEKFRGYAKISSCGELVRKIYGDTQIMSLAAIGKSEGQVEEARANLQRLYDYARSFERSGDRGLYAFISFIDELTENDTKIDVSQFSSAADAVWITTVHGSKGLEYNVCFLCDTAHEFYRRESAEDVAESRTLPLSMRINGGESKLETPMRSATLLSTLDRKTDEFLRTLYVALTRAKKRLIITAEAKDAEYAAAKYDYTSGESECSMACGFYSPYARQKSKCFLDLLCLALAGKPELCAFELVTEIAPVQTSEEKTETLDRMTYTEAKRLVSQRLDFEYPYAALSGVPSKLSVSKLYPDVLDDDKDADALSEPDISIAEPAFLREDRHEADAAEKGTAMHIFMQFFDFDSVEKLGVRGEIKRLAENKFIFPDDVGKLDPEKLERFFSSSLAAQMRASKQIFREKRFIIYYPAKDFSEDEKTKAALKDEKLLVQGVIDCAFFNDKNELVLVDYKTDSFPEGTGEDIIRRTLIKRHGRQLGYYKYACRSLFSHPAAHTYIYSFALDKAIEL